MRLLKYGMAGVLGSWAAGAAWAAAPGIHPLDADRVAWVESTLARLSIDQKVGQLIIPGLRGNGAARAMAEARENILSYHVGGYHIFRGDPEEAARTIGRLQEMASVPLLITADLEGGAGFQFRGATRLPRGMALGATGNPDLAFEAGRITAIEGRGMGIHVNFYPVVDINNNPRNPIINIRSFGEDVASVSRLAQSYIRGCQAGGMIATAKHFPGHGDTEQDSHLALPSILASRERLDAVELPPFQAAIDAGVMAVMSAHLYVPALETEKGLPATLSERILTRLLRDKMGFSGLLFTDAMTMRGITNGYTSADAAVRAYLAGADFILHPPRVGPVHRALRDAVRTGRISQERLDESVRKILAAKARLDLNGEPVADAAFRKELLGSFEHVHASYRIIADALTLVKDEPGRLPLRLPESKSILHLNLVDGPGWVAPPGRTFFEELRVRHPKATHVELRGNPSRARLKRAEEEIARHAAVVVTAFIRVSAYKGSIDLPAGQLALLKKLSRGNKPVIFGLFGSPFLLSAVPDLPVAFLAYDYYREAEIAAVQAIVGEIGFRGRLPVRIPGLYPIGHAVGAAAAVQ